MKIRIRIISIVLAVLLSVSPLAAEAAGFTNEFQAKISKMLLELALTAGGVEYDIKQSYTDFIVYITDEEMSEILTINMLFGTDESDKELENLVQINVDWLSSIYTDIVEMGMDNLNVLFLWVYSFDEPDYVFLAVCNNEMIYDWSASHRNE